MRRLNRRNNVPIIFVVVLVLLLILAVLAIIFRGGGNLLGTASQLPTPTQEATLPPVATQDDPPAEATATPVPPTSTALPTEEPSPTSEPTADPSPTSEPPPEPSPTNEPPTATPAPVGSVHPVVECVTANGDGTYTAYFGYHNDGDAAVTIPIGARNRVAPGPEDRGQPTTFSPGGTASWPNAPFSVAFSGGSLGWTVDGHTATASPDSPRCVYRVHIGVRWYDTDGNPLAGPPETLPPGFTITAQSEAGSATCTYPDGSSLVCQYDNQSGGGGALLVPAGSAYSIDELGLPAGWQPFSGVGVFPGSGASETVNHVVDNRVAGAPTPSPTPTLGASEISGATPTSAPPEPAAPTEPPAGVATPVPSEPPATAETPAATDPSASPEPTAIAQATPSPSAAGTAAPLLPASGGQVPISLLGVGSLALGLALTLIGAWSLRRRRSD